MTEFSHQITDMWARDSAAHALGARLVSVQENAASLSLQVADAHLNSHAICHGGVIFTLADCAFGYASNAGPEVAVTQSSQITYLAPVRAGEVLMASATLISRSGRSGIFDVTVTTPTGTVALLRAQARFIGPQRI